MVAVDGRWYRGRVLIARRPGGLIAVNWVDLEQYLSSVVGSEVYPSWDADALMAQAIAARSYAMHYRYHPVNQDWYDLGSDTRYQQYSGVGREFNTTQQAVEQTRGLVLTTNGEVLQAMYASTQAITDSHHAGVGMSQHGAAQLASNGANYLSILSHYYPSAYLGQLLASYH
jgi:peptidoglycan hydrolase-like amidase